MAITVPAAPPLALTVEEAVTIGSHRVLYDQAAIRGGQRQLGQLGAALGEPPRVTKAGTATTETKKLRGGPQDRR